MRQRHVFPAAQVIHLWAHQSQDDARSGSNVSFEGKLLYSYSTVIAQIEDDAAGNRWAFLSDSSLTPTTGKHVSTSRQATQHLNRFYTPAFANHWQSYSRTPAAIIQAAIDQAAADLQDAFKPRTRATTKANAINQYNARRDTIQTALAAFNLPAADLPGFNEAVTKQWTEAAASQQKAAREAKQAREAAQRADDLEAYTTWLTTGAGYYPTSYRVYGTDQIAIRAGEILTSQGARCPLDHAVTALKFWLSRQQYEGLQPCGTWTPYHTNGHKIPLGVFTLDAIDEHGTVRAGCHTFTAQEIDRFINQWREVLGL